MMFGSVSSGIEAASVAWGPLGWKAAWLSEIESFPCAVLAHHYPNVPNVGDMRQIPMLLRHGMLPLPDLLCGGTPCQAFSVAGARRSLDDERGNLSLTFCEIADELDAARQRACLPACVVFWENVPGVLNTKDNAFGCFLAGLAGEDEALQPAGGRWTDAGVVLGPARAVAWRVLDAQYFGLAQRRKRVFVVASARDDFDPVAVLLEPDGVRRDTAPSREAGEGVAACLDAGPDIGGDGSRVSRLVSGVDFQNCATTGGLSGTLMGEAQKKGGQAGHGVLVYGGNKSTGPRDVASTLTAHGGRMDFETETFVAHPLRGEGFDAREDGTGRGTPLVPVPFDTTQITSAANRSNPKAGDPCHLLAAGGHAPAIAFALRGRDEGAQPEIHDDGATVGALRAGSGGSSRDYVAAAAVRRLMPHECERLQGFPDDYTLIPHRGKPAADGPRYKALGNSWAVPVVRWIGIRIMINLIQRGAPQ